MRALGTADGRFVAVRHDDKEVNVTVVVRVAPGMRAIQPDLLGLKLRHEPLSGRLKQSISKHFHDRFLTDGVGEGKPRFIRANLRSRLNKGKQTINTVFTFLLHRDDGVDITVAFVLVLRPSSSSSKQPESRTRTRDEDEDERWRLLRQRNPSPADG